MYKRSGKLKNPCHRISGMYSTKLGMDKNNLTLCL